MTFFYRNGHEMTIRLRVELGHVLSGLCNKQGGPDYTIVTVSSLVFIYYSNPVTRKLSIQDQLQALCSVSTCLGFSIFAATR